ncbi:hypothetical protein, partial [Mesotoga prima]|uniref:hypothetical protein n=1 Tax=Mesotoga prima TaxID=1184387 RepID=UPI002CCC5A3D
TPLRSDAGKSIPGSDAPKDLGGSDARRIIRGSEAASQEASQVHRQRFSVPAERLRPRSRNKFGMTL